MICVLAPDRRARAGLVLLLAALTIAALAACDVAPDEPAPEKARVAETGGAPAPIEMPPPGQARLLVRDDGITLLANAAPRGPLLGVLAMQLRFELEASDLSEKPVTIALQRGQLQDALPTLLSDRAYRVDYRYDSENARHEVARLRVAAEGAEIPPDAGDGAKAAKPSPVAEPSAPAEPSARAQPSAPAEPSALAEPSAPAAEEKIDWKQLVARLDDSDPDERIVALEQIDPEGEGLPLIVDRLARDPDSRVRIVAAEKLEFSDTLAGVDALVGALSDSDRDVVLAAIEALELTDDYSVTQDLKHLLAHPDADIRKAAREAIDFIDPDDDD